MATIEIKVTLDDRSEISITQRVHKSDPGAEASIPEIGTALMGAAVPAVVRALGLRTEADQREILQEASERASAMVEQIREAEAQEAAKAEQEAAEMNVAVEAPDLDNVKETVDKALRNAGDRKTNR